MPYEGEQDLKCPAPPSLLPYSIYKKQVTRASPYSKEWGDNGA